MFPKGHVRNRVTGSGGELKVTQGPSPESGQLTQSGVIMHKGMFTAARNNTIAMWMDHKLGAQ